MEKFIKTMLVTLLSAWTITLIAGIVAGVTNISVLESVLDWAMPITTIACLAAVTVAAVYEVCKDFKQSGHLSKLGVGGCILLAAATLGALSIAHWPTTAKAQGKAAKCVIVPKQQADSITSLQACDSTQTVQASDFGGLYFSTDNVVEEFEMSHTGHYVLYDDADANMEDAIIRLSPSSYGAVMLAVKSGKELHGHLQPTRENEIIEYNLIIMED